MEERAESLELVMFLDSINSPKNGGKKIHSQRAEIVTNSIMTGIPDINAEQNNLIHQEIPVRFRPDGKVSSEWRNTCKENRHQTQDILRKITSLENLAEACKKVVKNDGGPGIDGMTVDDLKRWFANNWQTLQKAMLNGTYKPKPTKGIKIPKPKGGERLLGIPTVIDRLVQQAIAQILQTIYDPTFSKHSYGFRPKRNAHHALLQATKCVCEGKSKVIDLDLENFFGEVNHQRLLATLRTRIGDKRLIWILNLTLKTGILLDGVLGQQGKGTPQGSPLSPLLSNIT